MSSMDGLERRAEAVAPDLYPSLLRRRAPVSVFLVGTAVVALLVALFLAGYRVASIWAALAIVAWMFVSGAARASE